MTGWVIDKPWIVFFRVLDIFFYLFLSPEKSIEPIMCRIVDFLLSDIIFWPSKYFYIVGRVSSICLDLALEIYREPRELEPFLQF